MDTSSRHRTISDCIAGPGFAIISVGYGECDVPGCDCEPSEHPWSYTIGRAERGWPEFVVLGVPAGFALGLADWAHRRWEIRPGLTRRPARYAGHLVRADRVPDEWLTQDWGRMGGWFDYYLSTTKAARLPDVVQLVWADHGGHFPDHPRCDRFVVASQPLLAQDPLSYPQAS